MKWLSVWRKYDLNYLGSIFQNVTFNRTSIASILIWIFFFSIVISSKCFQKKIQNNFNCLSDLGTKMDQTLTRVTFLIFFLQRRQKLLSDPRAIPKWGQRCKLPPVWLCTTTCLALVYNIIINDKTTNS